MTEFLDKHVDVIIVDQRKSSQDKLSIPISTNQSRVASMIKRTMTKTRSGSSSVKEIGKRWNILIYDYRAILTQNILPGKKTKECSKKTSKARELKAPFIKVEDRSQRYRPYFAEMRTIPFIDFKSQAPKSPFETWYNENVPTSRQAKLLQSRTCELCQGTYSDLDSHLVSVRHTAAANDNSLFEGVDNLIRRGRTVKEFVKETEDRLKLKKKG